MSMFDDFDLDLTADEMKEFAAEIKKRPKKKKAKKTKKTKPKNPNIARKYFSPRAEKKRLGEPHGFIPAPPPKHLGTYEDKRIIKHGKFILPVMAHYMLEELEAATYHPFDFIGVSPVWPTHLHIGVNQ